MVATSSWTRENATGNQFLYNGGTELNGTTAVYDLFYRNYDPVLGRMHQVDPKADKYAGLTPYNYAFNDPAYWNDPWGDEASAEQEAEWKLERERWVQYGSIQAARASGFRSGMWPAAGDDTVFPRFGPGDNGGLRVFMFGSEGNNGVLAGAHVARMRKEKAKADADGTTANTFDQIIEWAKVNSKSNVMVIWNPLSGGIYLGNYEWNPLLISGPLVACSEPNCRHGVNAPQRELGEPDYDPIDKNEEPGWYWITQQLKKMNLNQQAEDDFNRFFGTREQRRRSSDIIENIDEGLRAIYENLKYVIPLLYPTKVPYPIIIPILPPNPQTTPAGPG